MSISLQVSQGPWDDYVDAHPSASIYHRSAWKSVIQDTFGKSCYYLASLDSGQRIRGVLPLARLNGALTADILISLPYCSFGGVLAEDSETARELLGEAVRLGQNLRCDLAEIRGDRFIESDGWAIRSDKVRMVLPLPDSPEELGRQLGAKRRAQIKRPRRENPEIRFGGSELIADFYGVFAKKMRDLGTPVYPISFFRNVEKYLRDAVRIVVVSIGSQTAAAAFLIRHRDEVEIPWAASDRDFDKISVNMLLYWEAVSFAIESGGRSFDFGRCTIDSGTYRFKRQWGAEPLTLGWQSWSRGEGSAGSVSSSRSAQTLSRMWKKLPLPIANWLGPKVTSNLPW